MSNTLSSVSTYKESPSQTAGPYVHIGFLPAQAGLNLRTQEKLNILTGPGIEGETIRIEGVVYDGSGGLVKDAVIESWQADAKGRHNQSAFFGWARAAADFNSGEWYIETIKPGIVPWQDGRPQAPHISLLVFARGINVHLHTRLYFEDEVAANEADPVLKFVEPHLRPTLIAKKSKRGSETVYRLDIVLQGDNETVFFDM
jgi:protocatechuate 3,4-dioxygenase alpha subunit